MMKNQQLKNITSNLIHNQGFTIYNFDDINKFHHLSFDPNISHLNGFPAPLKKLRNHKATNKIRQKKKHCVKTIKFKLIKRKSWTISTVC